MKYTIETTDPARPEQTITWRGEPVEILATDKTEIVLLRTPTFGDVLFMDGSVQSSSYDQVQYHTALVAPAATAASVTTKPGAQAIVLGGGEGCTSAMALLCGAGTVTQIDYDGEAVRWAGKALAAWNNGVYSDPRVKVIVEDAFAACGRKEPPGTGKRADLVVVDLFDPCAETAASYATAMGAMIQNWLTPTGALVAYFGLWPGLPDVTSVTRQIETACGKAYRVRGYVTYIPCFCAECLFLLIIPSGVDDPVLGAGLRWVL
jgi:spermidine synthase